MNDLLVIRKPILPPNLWGTEWIVCPAPGKRPPEGYCTLKEAARQIGLSPRTTRRLAGELGWRTIRTGKNTFYQREDVRRTEKSDRVQPPAGFISVREARIRTGVSQSGIYKIAKQHGWTRFMTPARNLFFLEIDVSAYLEQHEKRVQAVIPHPQEIAAGEVPPGYIAGDEIMRRYPVSRLAVYFAAARHFWRRAYVGRLVYFHEEDVLAYFDPDQAGGYTLKAAADHWAITPVQAALAARINGWRRISDRRFRVWDVEQTDAIRGIADYVWVQEVIRQLGVSQNELLRHWKENHWPVDYIRIGKSRAMFVRRCDFERYLRTAETCTMNAYYSTRAIRDLLGVSRQRVGQLAAIYQWQRMVPSPRHVLYLRRDVEAYLARRREGSTENQVSASKKLGWRKSK